MLEQPAPTNYNSLRIAKVVAVHPEQHVVSLVFLDDGSRLSGVQVLSAAATTNTGFVDLPEPDPSPDGNDWSPAPNGTRDMYVIVAYLLGQPIVLGFLPPQVCQLNFDQKGRMIYRHGSDVYFTVDKDGNTELFHPSGTYIRIGEVPDHEDLTGQDLDGKWAIERNTDKKPYVRLQVVNEDSAPDPAATIEITPGGTVNITATGNVNVSGATINLN